MAKTGWGKSRVGPESLSLRFDTGTTHWLRASCVSLWSQAQFLSLMPPSMYLCHSGAFIWGNVFWIRARERETLVDAGDLIGDQICLGVLKRLALEPKRCILSLDQTCICWWGLSFTNNKAILISRESRRIYISLYGAESENRKCKKIIAIHRSALKPDLICAFQCACSWCWSIFPVFYSTTFHRWTARGWN